MVVWLSDVLRLWYAGTAWPKEYHSFVLLLLLPCLLPQHFGLLFRVRVHSNPSTGDLEHRTIHFTHSQ